MPPTDPEFYLLYLPSGAAFSDNAACGHHAHYPDLASSLGDEYAAVRHCVFEDQSILKHQTITASHEIAEAVTDSPTNGYRLPLPPSPPWAGSVWQSIQPPRIEVGDLCEGTRIKEGVAPTFSYQRVLAEF